jgi:hypothetical protein
VADHSSIGVLPSVSGFDRDTLTMRRLRHEDCRVITKNYVSDYDDWKREVMSNF